MYRVDNFHAILVSQLSREIEKRQDPRPKMSDYAEAGTIEQVAETCMFSFRGYVFDNERYSKYDHETIIAKARYGEPQRYPMGFNGDKCKLYYTATEAEMVNK